MRRCGIIWKLLVFTTNRNWGWECALPLSLHPAEQSVDGTIFHLSMFANNVVHLLRNHLFMFVTVKSSLYSATSLQSQPKCNARHNDGDWDVLRPLLQLWGQLQIWCPCNEIYVNRLAVVGHIVKFHSSHYQKCTQTKLHSKFCTEQIRSAILHTDV